MGVNCPACGELLTPEPTDTNGDGAKLVRDAVWVFRDKVLGMNKTPTSFIAIKKHHCRLCKTQWLVIDGPQPRIYQGMMLICLDDGEGSA